MNKFYYVLTTLAIILLFAMPATTSQAQMVFNGHDLNKDYDYFKKKCEEYMGTWDEMGLVAGRYFMAECLFEFQNVVENPDSSMSLIKPLWITYKYDLKKDRLETAIFSYDFFSWSMREQAKKSVKKDLPNLFKGFSKRLLKDIYVLRYLDDHMYLEFLAMEKTEGLKENESPHYFLGLSISRSPTSLIR